MVPFVIGSQKENARDSTTPLEQRLGQATSVVIPLLELGAVGYITWVLCFLICTQYILNPSAGLQQNFNVQPRHATAIALIVIYAILTFFLLLAWMRLFQVIWSKPDILAKGNPAIEKKDASTSYIDKYDAFICDYEGFPLYCQKCNIYKPDRVHHCKELGRCVRKMDHYCPWAGGIIAESTHKFFMQFVSYGALYTTFVWLVVAIFLAERSTKVSLYGCWDCLIWLTMIDWIPTRHLDRSISRCSPILYLQHHDELYDGLQSGYQLHLGRSDSKGRCLQCSIPHYQILRQSINHFQPSHIVQE